MSWHFGIWLLNPFSLWKAHNDGLKIVAVFPEFHPRVENYDSTHNFVGQCVSDQARAYQINDDAELKSVLDMFAVKEESQGPNDERKLIYMSLGTAFNVNTYIYERFIEAICTYDLKSTRKLKSSQFRVIVSSGEKSLDVLSKKFSSGELKIPENVLIREKVPQLEILKRADLFVTHCGMNSTSETIKYAVPIVGVPLEGDQPLNARRACDELQLGIRLDPLKLSADAIADAIDSVLSDEKYAKNMKQMSDISARYNGRVDGAHILINCLNSSDSSKINSDQIKSNKVKPL